MTEASIFLLDLLLLGIGGVGAGIAAIALGGPRRNAPALVALGLYVVVAGIALALTPQLLWERARTDNAFLGHVVFMAVLVPVGLVFIAVGVRALDGRGRSAPIVGRILLLALAGAAFMLAGLIARGPAAWQTGSGQFGLEVIVATVAIGAAIFVLGRRLGGAPAGPASGAGRAPVPERGDEA